MFWATKNLLPIYRGNWPITGNWTLAQPYLSIPSNNSAWEETDLRNSRSFSTLLSFFIKRWTSIMSARMSSLVTADRRFLEARTMLPLLTELQGSAANSRAEVDMIEPAVRDERVEISVENEVTSYPSWLATNQSKDVETSSLTIPWNKTRKFKVYSIRWATTSMLFI